MTSTVGFAILGTGMVSAYHQQAVTVNADQGARLVAVGGHNPARFADKAAAFGVPCLSFDDLLARPDVDVICICTPSGQHAQQAIAAAAAGKHVLVEKPMALTLAAADAMISTAERAGVKFGVVLQRRAEPIFQQIHAAIQAGDLGSIVLGAVQIPYLRTQAYYDSAAWRGTWALDGGGVLINQGIHLIDLLVWYMGDPVDAQAYAATVGHQIEGEDVLGAVLRFEMGAIATITATTNAAPGFPHRLELYGTKGGIQIEGENVVRWQLADPQKATVRPPEQNVTPQSAGAGSDPRGIRPSGHIAIVRDFISAIRENRQPLAPGAEGRRSLAAILKIYAAAGLPGR